MAAQNALPPEPARVLFLQGSSHFGGSKRSLLAMIDVLRAAGGTCVAACPEEGWLTGELKRRGVPFVLVPFLAWRKWMERFRVAPAIKKRWLPKLTQGRFDVVHSNEFWWAPHAVLLGRHLNVPAVVHLRDGHHSLPKALQYRLAQAAAVIAVSSELRAQFAADQQLHRRTRVIFNGHESPRYAGGAAAARVSFGLAAGELAIGSAGRLCDRKNQALLLRAVAPLKRLDSVLPFKVLLAGDSDLAYELELRRLSRQLGLEADCLFLGLVEDMGRFYAAVDVVAHCARREGLPRVLPEAMLAGKPVVSTAVEGARDCIPEARFGAVVSLEDDAALAGHLARFLSDPSLREEIGASARSRAESLFSLEAHQRNLLSAYAELRKTP